MLFFYKTKNIKINNHYYQHLVNPDFIRTFPGIIKTSTDIRNFILFRTQIKKRVYKYSIKKLKKSLAKVYINYTSPNYLFFTEILLNIFTISSSLKQYKTYLCGFNYKFYKYFTVGPILKKAGLLEKNLKKSKKGMKFLFSTISYIFGIQSPYIIFLKPLNKKNYKFFKFIRTESTGLDSSSIGFLNHYNTIFRRIRRIKKNIKKRLLHSERFITTI